MAVPDPHEILYEPWQLIGEVPGADLNEPQTRRLREDVAKAVRLSPNNVELARLRIVDDHTRVEDEVDVSPDLFDRIDLGDESGQLHVTLKEVLHGKNNTELAIGAGVVTVAALSGCIGVWLYNRSEGRSGKRQARK